MSSPHIGLIGVGLMGHGIALNIARKGYALTVLEHPGNQPLTQLQALGVQSVDSLKALAASVDVLVLCVTGSPQVEAILLGDEGALAAMKPGSAVIDCSTALPDSTERVAAMAAAVGIRFIDAPMTRTPREAAEGRLNLLVGGDAAVLAECMPILRSFAENVTHTGAVGTGHRMKLLHNYVSLGTVALISEAAACAFRGGVSPEVFVDVLAKGGGGGVALERLRPFLLDQDPSGLRFFMGNALKDMGYYVSMAHDTHAAQDIADAVHDTYASAVAQAGAEALVPSLVTTLQRGVGHSR
ncbi:NAD(P)-dependent oxidoreductase [Diaphorobacter aerolatus]|uniref:NAD(P)-dependent oxidoreductase n=1 Tax=Diaphorobacter aerolatus TaxID=1288495 RepID=A0A7H0GLL7_9BURK|nr:NAD(P)-dependent oxidoreductase [Diaphorobacter aerolatus]QNP49183.1 NAD(P)-dependent oxidoreductase [Diaphorobacter aerolatus]